MIPLDWMLIMTSYSDRAKMMERKSGRAGVDAPTRDEMLELMEKDDA